MIDLLLGAPYYYRGAHEVPFNNKELNINNQ